MREPQPENFFRKTLSARATIAVRLEWRLFDGIHYHSQIIRASYDEFVVCGGGNGLEVVGELGDLREVDRREDEEGGGFDYVGESESRSDGIYPEAM